MTRFDNIDYHYVGNKKFPNGYVSMEVYLDDTTHRRYLSYFGMNQDIGEERKGLPPKDWRRNSKSFFEK